MNETPAETDDEPVLMRFIILDQDDEVAAVTETAEGANLVLSTLLPMMGEDEYLKVWSIH